MARFFAVTRMRGPAWNYTLRMEQRKVPDNKSRAQVDLDS